MQERWDDSIPATRSNAKPSARARKKQKDFSQITCFSYNKKGYYSKDCIEPKAKN